jgi:hypothetical protein
MKTALCARVHGVPEAETDEKGDPGSQWDRPFFLWALDIQIKDSGCVIGP